MWLRDRSAQAYARSRWPRQTTWFALAIVVAVVLVALGVWRSLWFLLLAPVPLVLMAVLAGSRIWFAHQTQHVRALLDAVWSLGGFSAESDLVFINLGGRSLATELALRMRHGRVRVLDVYSPQVAPSRALMQTHAHDAARPDDALAGGDPRLAWLNGRIDLLPLPNAAAEAVVSNQVLSEMPLSTDRAALIDEVMRILRPGSLWVVTERVQPDRPLWLADAKLRTPDSAETWRTQFANAGFIVRQEEAVTPLVTAWSLRKPGNPPPRQLRFPF